MLTMDQINNIRFLKRTQGKTYKEVESALLHLAKLHNILDEN